MKINQEFKFVLYAHIFIALFLIYQLFDLITLLYDDSHQYAFLSNELNDENYINNQPQLIPKIIHQTYKTNEIPNEWKEGQKNCQILNPDYHYILWTDEMARDFIAEKYPWFLKTFDSYPYNIERADSIRYFILAHYGGIYIDLDDGCNRNLDPLLTVPAFVRKTLPTGVSNDVLGSVPNHPFFTKAISMLQKYQRNWIVPYITVMFSTGPLYLSVVWKQYIRWGNPPSGIVRILMPDDYKSNENSFFKIAPGSSWHEDDAVVLLLMSNHLVITVFLFTLLGFTIVYVEYLMVYLFNKYCYPKCSKLFNNLTNSFISSLPTNLQEKYFSNRDLSAINNSNSNSNKLNYYSLPNVRKSSRKDSNLPVALSVDLEKNVHIFDEIEEY